MSEEEEEEEEEKEKSILERPISRAFVDCSSFKKRTRSGNVVFGGERKAECIFFPRFNDASETFSLDVLVAGKLNDDDDDDDDSERGGRRRRKNDENDSFARSFVHFRTDGLVSKPKGGVIYENWYQRAKEALSPRGEGRDDAYYEISIEEKNKKRSERKKEVGGDDDDDQDDDDDDVSVVSVSTSSPISRSHCALFPLLATSPAAASRTCLVSATHGRSSERCTGNTSPSLVSTAIVSRAKTAARNSKSSRGFASRTVRVGDTEARAFARVTSLSFVLSLLLPTVPSSTHTCVLVSSKENVPRKQWYPG